jgi:sugar phosphate isomerase/epimerase
MHPPYRWQRSYRRWLLTSLAEVEARTGITVAMENMFPVHIGSRPLLLHADQDLDQLTGMPHLVLDTSHAAVAKHDLIEVRRLFGDRLRHVHLSDNAGKGWDSHLPPGEGVLDLDGFLRDLADSDFDGTRRACGRCSSTCASGSSRCWPSRSYPAGMRRATAITLVILFVLLVIAAAVQFSQPTPSEPFPGPSSGTELPSPTP